MTPQEAAFLIDSFLDGSCGPSDWDDFTSSAQDDPAVERARRMCVDVRNQYPSAIASQYCNDDGCAILRQVAADLREPSRTRCSDAHAIVADALEAAAQLQDDGLVKRLGEAFEPTYARVIETDANVGEVIAFALTFWDEWVDAANHDWKYHDPIRESDWPRFAREISTAVRLGRLPDNQFLLEQFRLKPRRTLRQWFSSLFKRAD